LPPRADRPVAPPVAETGPPVLPKAQHFRLSNGLAVTLLERHATPLLQVDWVLMNNGFATDEAGIPGGTMLALEMLSMGTDHLTAEEVRAREGEQGISSQVEVAADLSSVRFSGLATNPEKTFALLSDELRHPAYREADFKLYKDAWASRLSAYLQPAAFARFIGMKLTYGQTHPYALSPDGMGGWDTLRQLTVENLRDFQRKWIRPDNGELLVVGDISRAELQKVAEHYFGDWRAPTEPLGKL
jgi:zinc protease